jgi:hypothetical protein
MTENGNAMEVEGGKNPPPPPKQRRKVQIMRLGNDRYFNYCVKTGLDKWCYRCACCLKSLRAQRGIQKSLVATDAPEGDEWECIEIMHDDYGDGLSGRQKADVARNAMTEQTKRTQAAVARNANVNNNSNSQNVNNNSNVGYGNTSAGGSSSSTSNTQNVNHINNAGGNLALGFNPQLLSTTTQALSNSGGGAGGGVGGLQSFFPSGGAGGRGAQDFFGGSGEGGGGGGVAGRAGQSSSGMNLK